MVHHYRDLITIFADCFASDYNTRLVKGDDEPIYLPADESRNYHALYFAHGFFSSALHECSHWLIAGEERRKLVDFGYWYMPDGRNAEQQAVFERVEVKPQALEWILSVAAGHRFRISADNLNGAESDTAAFKEAVHNQVKTYITQGLTARVLRFRNALCEFYHQPLQLDLNDFQIDSI